MSHKSWLVLLALAGALFCVSYLYLANEYCPVEQSGPNLNWRLIPDLNKNEKHDRAAYRYGRNKNKGHSVPTNLPSSYTLVQQVEAKKDADLTEGEGHVWLTKFACEAKLSDLLIAFFTYGLFLATGWLVWATLGLWKSTDQSIKLSNSEYTSTHRPRISVRRVRITSLEERKPLSISYRIVNSGETAAHILSMNGSIIWMNELSPVPIYDDSRTTTFGPTPNAGLASGQWIEMVTTLDWPMIDDAIRSIHTSVVLLIGFVRYADDSGIVREMAFGRQHSDGRFVTMRNDEYEYQD
jgi:hypothetical protein